MRVVLALIALGACSGDDAGTTTATADPSTGTETPPAGPPSGPIEDTLCLPLVTGCGCAIACSAVMNRVGDRYEIVREFPDARLERATLERRCFDARGSAYPEDGAPPEATNCRDVFYDQSPCGGECIPTVEFLSCHIEDHRCVR
jgi:hypothetical protein